MPLFEVAILEMPTKDASERHSDEERLVVAPFAVIAKDKDAAVLACTLQKTENLKNYSTKNLKVLVRPFA